MRLVRVAKVLRLLKLSSVYHYVHQGLRYLENQYEIRISEMLVKISRLVLLFLVLSHWIGCINWMICRVEGYPNESWIVNSKLAGVKFGGGYFCEESLLHDDRPCPW